MLGRCYVSRVPVFRGTGWHFELTQAQEGPVVGLNTAYGLDGVRARISSREQPLNFRRLFCFCSARSFRYMRVIGNLKSFELLVGGVST